MASYLTVTQCLLCINILCVIAATPFHNNPDFTQYAPPDYRDEYYTTHELEDEHQHMDFPGKINNLPNNDTSVKTNRLVLSCRRRCEGVYDQCLSIVADIPEQFICLRMVLNCRNRCTFRPSEDSDEPRHMLRLA